MRFGLTAVTFLLLASTPAFASIVQINGKWSDDKYAPKYSVTEHFNLGKECVEKKEWKEANTNFLIITHHFPESPFYGEALFFSGICFYHLKDYDMANKHLSRYLNEGTALHNFEKAFEYKVKIADAFADGARRHLFGMERLPKLSSGKKEGVAIYDEVIAALPSREIALQALFNKGRLLFDLRSYKECVETFATLVRRFPKHTLAAESYLQISQVYLEQAKLESQNPDFISLAKVNLQRFHKSFPGDERSAGAEKNLAEMREIYAKTLYDIALFYERKKKPKASLVYYQEALKRYPGTDGAKKALAKIQLATPPQVVEK